MKRRWLWWVIALLVIVGAPVAWYLGSPLFINRTVSEALPPSGAASDAPAIEARGTFTDADDFHKGSGNALIVRVGDDRVMRFEEFNVTNGPDLYVYLAAHPQPRSRADVDQGFVNLSRLKGNIGAQNYAVPASVRLETYQSVVIYCRRFHVVFSTATLQAVQ